MYVDRITTLRELDDLRVDWNRLASDVPFRRWEWMRAWWVHFEQHGELFVLVVRDDDDQTIGIAPWFVERSLSSGRQIRFLGSGTACSEYLSLLCDECDQEDVAPAVANWLINAPVDGSRSPERNAWDLLHFTGVESGDRSIDRLKHHLTEFGGHATERQATNCWRIAIPKTWDEYLAARPNPYRRKIRRLKEKMLDSGRACGQLVTDPHDIQRFFETLVELHQKRRASLNQRGCFESPAFRHFLSDVIEQFVGSEHLFLAELTIDGQMAAASLGLVFDGVNYVYQCGMLPQLSRCQPGWLLNIFTVQHAIDHQLRGVDFLCGNQPYKAHLGARPVPMTQVSISAPRPLAVLRHQLLLGGERLKDWLHLAPKRRH